MHLLELTVLVGLVASGCGGESEQVLTHSFDAITLAPGQERTGACVSWQLDNDEPFYVNAIEMDAGPGWHHSNWFVVREGTLDFDGTEDVDACSQHFADSLALGIAGRLLFGQSTQARHEVERFPAGAGIYVPAHAVIVGDIHLVNTLDEAVTTSLNLTLTKLPDDEVRHDLRAMGLAYQDLEVRGGATTEVTSTCDLAGVHERAYGRPLDWSIHYILPHFHARGVSAKLEVIGGPHDGLDLLAGSSQTYGEPLGVTFDEPFSLEGATGLRFGCTYENPDGPTLGWGNARDAEMCAIGAAIDAETNWLGGVLNGSDLDDAEDGDGALRFSGPCTVGLVNSRL